MKTLFLILGLFFTIGLFAQDVINLDNEFIHSPLQFGTRRVVNTIDTICSDSGYVYLSICNAPGNTNNIQYKGAYGVWQVLGANTTVVTGDRIRVIGSFYTKSTATTDTVYLFIQKQ